MKVKTSFFLFFLTFLSCNKINEFDLQGHRGYRGLYPENSTIGFLKSLHLGVSTIELDVVISKDKKVVVSHEPWISKNICVDQNGNRIINDKEDFNIYSMDYNDIKKFDCGIIGNDKFPDQKKISVFKPTLNHVIKTVENGSMTKDLAMLVGKEQTWLNTYQFIEQVEKNLIMEY